jgi:hypothetical protein
MPAATSAAHPALAAVAAASSVAASADLGKAIRSANSAGATRTARATFPAVTPGRTVAGGDGAVRRVDRRFADEDADRCSARAATESTASARATPATPAAAVAGTAHAQDALAGAHRCVVDLTAATATATAADTGFTRSAGPAGAEEPRRTGSGRAERTIRAIETR